MQWVVFGTMVAEELGVTSANVGGMAANPTNQGVANLLGVGFDGAAVVAFGTSLGISADCLQDPLLNERGFWLQDESPEMCGAGIRMGGSLWHVDGTRTPIWRGASLLFSDTRAVLGDLLHYEPGQIKELYADGVVK